MLDLGSIFPSTIIISTRIFYSILLRQSPW
jgi:hypothetical protein